MKSNHIQIIRDGKGVMIGKIQPTLHQDIYSDSKGSLLGYSRGGRVFDRTGKMISMTDNPDMLFHQ